jgi:hypothetical protein
MLASAIHARTVATIEEAAFQNKSSLDELGDSITVLGTK